MGRDAGGHGHDPGEPGNPFHGKDGRFSDGGGSGGGGSKGGSARAHAAGEKAVEKALFTHGHLRVALAHGPKQKAAAAKGDHQKAQSHTGHGYPVTMHAGHRSVGTHDAGGGGGGSAGGSMRGSMKGGPMKTTTGLRQAAQERVAIGEDTDARHMPLSGSAQAQRLASRRLRNIPAGR